mgnify:CR=1 FL=1
MKTIILDTDFIINVVKNHIELEAQIKSLFPYKVEISYLDRTNDELKNKPFEDLARDILKNFKMITTTRDKTVDELILDISKNKKELIVATQDRKLKEKLKKGKIQVITIRQQKYITL